MTAEEACTALGQLAGWKIPPDVGDPYVIRLAHKTAALEMIAAEEYDETKVARLIEASRVLGVWS